MSRILHLAFESAVAAVSPALLIPTTPESIRDRIIAVIRDLTPDNVSGDRFVPYRNERAARFRADCEANPAGCRRRFQVRRKGGIPSAAVSNSDVEEREVTYLVTIAYPQTHRDGPDNALDRDDAIDSDMDAIEYAIGMTGRANFAAPHYPDACWREQEEIATIEGEAVDFLELELTYSYQRTRG